MSFFEYTTFEPGRQRSEVAISTDPSQRGIRAHPVSWNRIGWNVRLRQGSPTQANLGRKPSRGQHRTTSYNCWQLHSLPGYLHEHTPFRTQGLSGLIDHKGSVSYKLIRFSHHPTTIHAGSREPIQQRVLLIGSMPDRGSGNT